MAREAVAFESGGSYVTRLAQFFPDAIRVRIPVRLTHVVEGRGAGRSQENEPSVENTESTVIEYGTAHEVLFCSALPLEFEDKLRLKTADGALEIDAIVVAVQLNEGKMAVAARFTRDVANWIIKAGT